MYMVRLLGLFFLLAAVGCGGSGADAAYRKPEEFGARGDRRVFPFWLYYGRGEAGKLHFFPSGYMGDIVNLVVCGGSTENPAIGNSCIRVDYDPVSPAAAVAGWSGVYWLSPPNNWGTVREAGYNLRGARSLVFMARGLRGGERVAFFMGGVGGPHPDSGSSPRLPLSLGRDWAEYRIQLADIDLGHVVGGFALTLSRADNPGGAVFFLDAIRYEE